MKPAIAVDPLKAISSMARASCRNPAVTLRAAGGGTLSSEMRDEMLRRCAAGEYVELELDVYAFEQKPGEQNRNFIRFRDGALLAMGRTGVGTPFLRDHDQHDALARGGTVIASQTEKRGEGDYAIKQTVKLTATWAVELALRGLLSTVSIGWDPTAMVECSLCKADYYKCSHYPGQRYSMREMDDGSRRMVSDVNGPLVCELVYTAADLLETSAVNVPAVPAAHIEAIRAARAAQNRGTPPQEHEAMDPKIVALLGLAASAGDSEVTKAVESLLTAKKLVEQQRDEIATQLAATNAKLAGYETVLAKQAEDSFIDGAVRAGKLALGSQFEQALRAYHAKDADGAKALLASSPVVTPIADRRQSGGPLPVEPVQTSVDSAIEAVGGKPAGVRANLLAQGFSTEQVEKMLNRIAKKGA